MSFILDALKKSESERQSQRAPGISDVPDGSRTRRSSRWIWILAALLGVNAMVLIGLWQRPAAVDRAAEAAPAATTAAGAGDAGGKSFSTLVAEARDARPPPLEPQSAPEPATADGNAAPTTTAPAARDRTTPPRTRAATQASFNELRANGTLRLPDLHLDIHVYSDKPAERFVFVNMNKYREQGRLAEGPLVKEIVADGVILEHQGTEFLLPRE